MADAVHLTPESRLVARLEQDRFDPGALGPFAVTGAVLKSQGAVIRDLREGRHLSSYLGSLFVSTLVLSAAYGAILGLYQPGLQTLFAALKIPIVVLGTALLCTPTFFVFNSILGSKLTLAQTLAAVLFLSASAALVLIAFAPIAWLFTVSTEGTGFLRVLHLLVFLIATTYGLRSLNIARRYLNYIDATQTPIHGRLLLLWSTIALFVALQMAWYFRPLLVPGPFHSGQRGLFFDALSLWAGAP
jgi:hypothetical protein